MLASKPLPLLRRLAVALSIVMFAACQPEAPSSDRVVTFKGRTIDLAPYVEGFPYRGYTPVLKADKLYYYRVGATDQLMELDLSSDRLDLAEGRVLSDINFADRNVWGIRYRATDGKLYWSGDEQNDEVINLYRFDTETGAIDKLTDVPYIFGWRWSPDENQVAYIARLGDKDERLGELRILDVESGEERVVLQDTPEMRFTWSAPSWQPNGEGVVIGAVKNADRTYGNLLYIPLDEQPAQAQIVTDPEMARQFPGALEEWVSDDAFLFVSNESGYTNLYRYNVRTGEQTAVTTLEEDLGSVEVMTVDGEQRVLAVIQRPAENELMVLDPMTGEVSQREIVGRNVGILDEHEGEVLTIATSAASPFQIDALTISDDGLAFTSKITLPESLQEQIIHARVERVSYPTFDVDPETGEPRMLHGFLYHPENPLPEDEQLAMITSFYGGGNAFSNRIQILTQAGIYVFSPSPRGSSGFGRDFAALNDKDLGGNEIVDIIYAGKYLSERLGIPPERIGPYGGSHGGYATMRLLTFPGEINGTDASFDWGFGISHAGFSDIVRFYRMSNIPDWVTLEAGDPEAEFDKLMDRSPISHADKLEGRLLLTHGSNDSRVPVVESRTMAEALRDLGKPVTYIEFEGQGHGIKGLENTVQFYRSWFDFLDGLDEPYVPTTDQADPLPQSAGG